jgi:replicative DNA helicase
MTDNNRPAAGRLGPHSIEAEECVLGSVLINPEAISAVAEFLQPSDFFEVKHGWIWDAVLAVYARNEAVDNITVAEELRQRRQLEDIGGSSYITYLINNTPTFVHAETYGRLVERAAVRRRLMEAAGAIAQLAREESAELHEVISKAESTLFGVTDSRLRKEMVPMAQAVREYFDRIERLYINPEEQLGVPSGFSALDELLGGLQKSDLVIVAARPGVGKTSFLLSLAMNAARKANARIGVFSLEMGREQLIQRFFAIETGINSQRLRLGKLEAHEWDRFVEATGRLDNLGLYIDDTPGISVQTVRARCRRLYREQGLDMVIVDYLQLMSSGITSRQDNRVQEISFISRGLKEIARELNVPVLAAAQLSRAVEQRSDKRPQLSDLRESGSIEQDADVVIFLYRDELYDPNTERPNQADVIVAKHRNGPTGMITLYFRKELTQFVDMMKSSINLSNY